MDVLSVGPDDMNHLFDIEGQLDAAVDIGSQHGGLSTEKGSLR